MFSWCPAQTSPLISWKPPHGPRFIADIRILREYFFSPANSFRTLDPTFVLQRVRKAPTFFRIWWDIAHRSSSKRRDNLGWRKSISMKRAVYKIPTKRVCRASCSRRRIYPKYRLKTDKIDRVRRRWEARDWKNRSNQAYPRLITLNYSNNIFPSD